MKRFSAVLTAAALALGASSVAARADSIVYQSVPNLYAAPLQDAWCSDCYGGSVFEPLDEFTLSSGHEITDLELVTGPGTYYNGASGFTFEIYNSDHSVIIFSQPIAPTVLGPVGADDYLLYGTVSGLSLSAGTYWAGFIAPVMGVVGLPGGNGSLIDTTPHTGVEVEFLGGNTGYALSSSTPEASTWAMMLAGFAGLGGLALSRRKQSVAIAL